jgi:hypothetical protein
LQLPTCKAVSQRTVGRGKLHVRWTAAGIEVALLASRSLPAEVRDEIDALMKRLRGTGGQGVPGSPNERGPVADVEVGEPPA